MTYRIEFTKACFMQSAESLAQCPSDSGAEVAFAGRSNAGKSSAINALTGQGKLARTSKTPGRTRLINHFSLGESQRLVDLPGYGYAKVSKAMKTRWDAALAEYLQCRRSLRGLVLLMDIRHPLQEYDQQMILWSLSADLPVHLLLTKADKLKRGPAKSVLLQVRKRVEAMLSQHEGEGTGRAVSVQTYSALKRLGVEELQGVLCGWLAPSPGPEAEEGLDQGCGGSAGTEIE